MYSETKQIETEKKIRRLIKMARRVGTDGILRIFANSDYFTSPASSRYEYHGCHRGGLAYHSLKVYEMMDRLNRENRLGFDESSLILVGLMHDICKCDQYYVNYLKDEVTVSDKRPYIIKDEFPIGHGEKSVIRLLEAGVTMTQEEMIGIRYHMGPFDDVGLKHQKNWNDLAKLCFVADFFVANFVEKKVVLEYD